MRYNLDYINVKYALISCFLFDADKNILDVSYSVYGKSMTIQVVLLEGFVLSNERIDKIRTELAGFDIRFREIWLSKERFNDGKGDWQPQLYKWLDHLLFSKVEVL